MTPDVIVSSSNLVTEIVQQETRAIPIVFVFVGDPVGSGFVTNVAHPGGNLTGFPVFETAIAGKWVEILNEVAPHVSRVAFIMVPETPAHVGFLRAAEAAAIPLRVKLTALGVHTAAEIGTLSQVAEVNGGLIVVPHVTVQHLSSLDWRQGIAFLLAPRATMRAVVWSLGTNPIDPFRQGASYVDRILKGENHRPAGAVRRSMNWSSISRRQGPRLTVPVRTRAADEVIE